MSAGIGNRRRAARAAARPVPAPSAPSAPSLGALLAGFVLAGFVLAGFVLAGALLAAAAPARAGVRALLIGVSDYDNSFGLPDLRGPVNDVRLMRQVLRDRGVREIAIVADGIAGATRPTRANILGAMAELARRAGPGDLVYVQMSGHGTRQPDVDGDETDGLDEVFLPADAGRAGDGDGLIPNALTDDELGRAIAAIRRTGADVWFVLDSCFSGSGLRAAVPRIALRYVDPAVLGVAAAPAAGSGTGNDTVLEGEGPAPPGGLVAFYSARASEPAVEIAYPAADGTERWYGLFISRLAARLHAAGAISYRQLFQAVMADMEDIPVPGAARLQTPVWAGNMIDAAVLGNRGTVGIRRFALRGDRLLAGLVHGIADGTLVGLVADAADPPDRIIGHAQTEGATATEATLRPVAAGCTPRTARPCPTSGTLPPEARFAQVLARPVDLTLRLAPPRELRDDTPLAPDSAPARALTAAVSAINAEGRMRIRLDPAGHDVESYWDGSRLWFGTRAKIGASPAGLAVAPQPAALISALTRIARAETLARLLGAVAGGGSLMNPSPVRITARLRPSDPAALVPPGDPLPPRRECRAALDPARLRGAPPLPASAELKQCDRIGFRARGEAPGARDVNRIHIDARFCVTVAYERIEDTGAGRRLGPDMILCSDCPDGYSAGDERLFVIVTELRPNAEPLNLEGQLETCGPAAARTRGENGEARARLLSFLGARAGRPALRGGLGMGGGDVWIRRYDWRILPKAEVFRRAGRKAAPRATEKRP